MLPWLLPLQQQLYTLTERQQLAHALLFCGPEGTGKHLLVNWLAAVLLCKDEQHRPCEQCKSCLLRQAGNHPDLLKTDTEQSSIGVDAIRKISVFMQGAAQQHGARVVIITAAETMTEAAANALLKTLEEPPQNSYILLQSSQRQRLMPTILSRIQPWSVAAVFDEQAHHWLEQHSSRAVPDFLLRYSGGTPLKALAMLENGQADLIVPVLKALEQFFSGRLLLLSLVKQLDAITDIPAVLGWFLRQHLLAQQYEFARQKAITDSYNRFCHHGAIITGQNKSLALTAFLLEIKRLLR